MKLVKVDNPREGQRLVCALCGSWGDAARMVADLDGQAFQAYYHDPTCRPDNFVVAQKEGGTMNAHDAVILGILCPHAVLCKRCNKMREVFEALLEAAKVIVPFMTRATAHRGLPNGLVEDARLALNDLRTAITKAEGRDDK